MQELAAVAEAAEAGLLIVFAYVGGEVGDGDCADVGGGFDRADAGAGRGVGVLLDEGGVGGGAFVCVAGGFCGGCCSVRGWACCGGGRVMGAGGAQEGFTFVIGIGFVVPV